MPMTVSAPSRGYLNSTFTETQTSAKWEARPKIKIHPADALGIGDGARVRLGNDRGDVVVHIELFDGLQRGVVISGGVWQNDAFRGRPGHQRADRRRSLRPGRWRRIPR